MRKLTRLKSLLIKLTLLLTLFVIGWFSIVILPYQTKIISFYPQPTKVIINGKSELLDGDKLIFNAWNGKLDFEVSFPGRPKINFSVFPKLNIESQANVYVYPEEIAVEGAIDISSEMGHALKISRKQS